MSEVNRGGKGVVVRGGSVEQERGRSPELESGDGDSKERGGGAEMDRGPYKSCSARKRARIFKARWRASLSCSGVGRDTGGVGGLDSLGAWS